MPEAHGGGRACLFFVAFAAGIWLSHLLYGYGFSLFIAIGIGFIIALLYPVVAAIAVGVCVGLRKWAFPEGTEPEVKPWDRETKAYMGAFWPLSLSFWIMIFPFFWIFNRLFRN
jgi:hypothetical protein